MPTNPFVIHFGQNAPFRYHQEVAHIMEGAHPSRVRAMLAVIVPYTLGKEVVFALDLSGDERWHAFQHAVVASFYTMRSDRIPLSPAEEGCRSYHLALTTTTHMESLID